MGCGVRTEVMKWERWPYSISSLVPLIIGMGGARAWSAERSCSIGWPDAGVWPSTAIHQPTLRRP